MIDVYQNVQLMEPLIPSSQDGRLSALTAEIQVQSGRLFDPIIGEPTLGELQALLRLMNSYYTNLIEGHPTRPVEIEAALQHPSSGSNAPSRNSLLAAGHLAVEAEMKQRLADEPDLEIYGSQFIRWLHQEFINKSPESLRYVQNQKGERFPVEPGAFRDHLVTVGNHTPPAPGALDAYMERFGKFYGSGRIIASRKLVAAAAAHHRFAWIHPFSDGNGRVARLLADAAFARANLPGHGLWTLSRGFARNRSRYYQMLSNADLLRTSDTDGRGNLSERHLAEFCIFFLETALDQITFMADLLSFKSLSTRLERFVLIENIFENESHNRAGSRMLQDILFKGLTSRGKAQEVTGYSETTARKILDMALKKKLLQSESPRGKVWVTLSEPLRETLFPKLYLEGLG